jgi:transcription antitermination factor NusG
VRCWKNRRKELDMSLFPGYVFVNLNLRDRLGVLRAPGVVRFVLFQGQPAAIPESEIRALESSLSAGLQLQPHPYLNQGARVRVKRGPLVGSEGIMIHRKQRFRLVLSIDLIKRSVMIEVDEGDVEPL